MGLSCGRAGGVGKVGDRPRYGDVAAVGILDMLGIGEVVLGLNMEFVGVPGEAPYHLPGKLVTFGVPFSFETYNLEKLN